MDSSVRLLVLEDSVCDEAIRTGNIPKGRLIPVQSPQSLGWVVGLWCLLD
ncbi:hypothetical protein KBG23_00320 [Candidatus Dojkabacteria bacterium]|nr:hypothetical protein [Candidatus Dojkabacteria bacterium]